MLPRWHCARPWQAGSLFSGMKDPHRVSRETEAPGDARAPGMGAGQPQNGEPACRGRDQNPQFSGSPAPTGPPMQAQPLTRITLVKPFVPTYSHVASELVCR